MRRFRLWQLMPDAVAASIYAPRTAEEVEPSACRRSEIVLAAISSTVCWAPAFSAFVYSEDFPSDSQLLRRHATPAICLSFSSCPARARDSDLMRDCPFRLAFSGCPRIPTDRGFARRYGVLGPARALDHRFLDCRICLRPARARRRTAIKKRLHDDAPAPHWHQLQPASVHNKIGPRLLDHDLGLEIGNHDRSLQAASSSISACP